MQAYKVLYTRPLFLVSYLVPSFSGLFRQITKTESWLEKLVRACKVQRSKLGKAQFEKWAAKFLGRARSDGVIAAHVHSIQVKCTVGSNGPGTNNERGQWHAHPCASEHAPLSHITPLQPPVRRSSLDSCTFLSPTAGGSTSAAAPEARILNPRPSFCFFLAILLVSGVVISIERLRSWSVAGSHRWRRRRRRMGAR